LPTDSTYVSRKKPLAVENKRVASNSETTNTCSLLPFKVNLKEILKQFVFWENSNFTAAKYASADNKG